MDTIWQKLLENSVLGFVIVALRYLDIQDRREERKDKENNAKEKSAADREAAQNVAKAYADAINALARGVEANSSRFESSIKEFKEAVLEQYKNMGITQELLDVAKAELRRKPNPSHHSSE